MSSISATLKPLTSIRGLAALWVYLYHRSNMTTSNAFLRQFAEDGYFGLDIFFILSGFIISYVHLEEFAAWTKLEKNIARFLQLRLSRVYPLYILLLLIFVNFQRTGAGPLDFLEHVLLIQSWGMSSNTVWNVPDWSISVEWLIYLLFPFFACAIFSEREKNVFSFILIGCAFALWIAYLKVSGDRIHDMTQPLMCLPRGFFDFTIGIGLHNLYRRKFLEKLPWDAIAAGCLVAIAATTVARSRYMDFPDAGMIALFTVLVYALANIRSWGNYLFSNVAVVYLGTISYSIYMLQWLYLLVVARIRHLELEGQPFFDWHFPVETAGLLLVAAFSYHIFEDPARQWLRALIEEEHGGGEKPAG